ncbi:hypothetical protein NKH18_47250 [Streptomyces sp. M10(2022)]
MKTIEFGDPVIPFVSDSDGRLVDLAGNDPAVLGRPHEEHGPLR